MCVGAQNGDFCTGILGPSDTSVFHTACAPYHLRRILVAPSMPEANYPKVMVGDVTHRFDQDGKRIDESARQRFGST